MKSVKGTTINRMLGSLKRKPTATSPIQATYSDDDSPEVVAIRNITLFCESGKPGKPGGSDEELLYLPMIVDACESSPSAAKEASYLIRKFLSREFYNRPHMQYNGVMLIRILAENPGPTFTRNLDAKFVQSVKDLLRFGQDPNTRNLLVETLSKFMRDKAYYEGLDLLIEMWGREQEKMRRLGGPDIYRVSKIPITNNIHQGYPPPSQPSYGLPSAQELSMRIMEARTSANLLSELIESTPSSEIISNELIQDLASRCQNANLSMQKYISAKNPAPDNDILENLIETSDITSTALSMHQHALLKARKAQEASQVVETAPRSGSSSQTGLRGVSSRPHLKNNSPRSSAERVNDPSRSEIENPFSDSTPVLRRKISSTTGPESKYMMHAGGSDSISTIREKKNHSSSNTPIYRY